MPAPREREGSALAPRESESRENSTRAKLWQPASMLPDPNPQEGWSFRWVRTDVLGQSDALNVDRQRREGWEPVLASEYPEIQLGADKNGNVCSGGLMLCKRPIETTVSHRQALREKNARQVQSAASEHLKPAGNTNMRFDQPQVDTQVETGRPRNLTFRT